jgi:hypothetical protein
VLPPERAAAAAAEKDLVKTVDEAKKQLEAQEDAAIATEAANLRFVIRAMEEWWQIHPMRHLALYVSSRTRTPEARLLHNSASKSGDVGPTVKWNQYIARCYQALEMAESKMPDRVDYGVPAEMTHAQYMQNYMEIKDYIRMCEQDIRFDCPLMAEAEAAVSDIASNYPAMSTATVAIMCDRTKNSLYHHFADMIAARVALADKGTGYRPDYKGGTERVKYEYKCLIFRFREACCVGDRVFI